MSATATSRRGRRPEERDLETDALAGRGGHRRGPEQHEEEDERSRGKERPERQGGDDPLDPPHPTRLASGRRPHARRQVPEPLSATNMSGPAPVQAASPSMAAAPDRSGIRSASVSARASGSTREARPVAEGISGVSARPLSSSVPPAGACRATLAGRA